MRRTGRPFTADARIEDHRLSVRAGDLHDNTAVHYVRADDAAQRSKAAPARSLPWCRRSKRGEAAGSTAADIGSLNWADGMTTEAITPVCMPLAAADSVLVIPERQVAYVVAVVLVPLRLHLKVVLNVDIVK